MLLIADPYNAHMDKLEILNKAQELREAGKPFALATVIHTTGSTPQKAGATALFEVMGPVWGTLGGGCMEAESRRRALFSLDKGKANIFDLKLDEVTGWDDGLICGGKVRILVHPNPFGATDVSAKVRNAVKNRETGAIVTILSHTSFEIGDTFWISLNDSNADTDLREIPALQEAIAKSHAPFVFNHTSAMGSIELFVEPVLPPPALIIAGAGHIGKALAHQGFLLGFEVTVIDDRETFANAQNLPWVKHVVCGDIAARIADIRTDSQSYIVIVTRGHRHDEEVLAACIHKPAAFVGMIGSRRKSMLIRNTLLGAGTATKEEIDRVVSPVGLDIGAESVAEIALSIAAQLVSVRRRNSLDAPTMSFNP